MIDFSELINPKKAGNILDVVPFLREVNGIEDFVGEHPDWERALHYLLLVYHPRSKLVEDFTSADRRKDKAAAIAGYSLAKDKDSRILESLKDLTDVLFRNMVRNFLKYVNNRTWTMIVSYETAFDEFHLKILTPLDLGVGKDHLSAAKMKSGILAEMKIIENELGAYYQKFYMGDEKLIKEGTNKGGISPESIASHVQKT